MKRKRVGGQNPVRGDRANHIEGREVTHGIGRNKAGNAGRDQAESWGAKLYPYGVGKGALETATDFVI